MKTRVKIGIEVTRKLLFLSRIGMLPPMGVEGAAKVPPALKCHLYNP